MFILLLGVETNPKKLNIIKIGIGVLSFNWCNTQVLRLSFMYIYIYIYIYICLWSSSQVNMNSSEINRVFPGNFFRDFSNFLMFTLLWCLTEVNPKK